MIDFPLTKCSRRIRPTVSTISIPHHPLPGKQAAQQPSVQGVNFQRRSPHVGGQNYTPKHRHHRHIVICGVDEVSENLVIIAGAYLAHGFRERASELVAIEVGVESAMERQAKLVRDIDQERLNRIDRALLREAGDAAGGVIDLRAVAAEQRSAFDRQLRIGRLRALELLGLAE